MAEGTYVPPPAGPVTAAAPRTEPVPVVPPPATPTQAELDAMAEGTYPAVPKREERAMQPQAGREYTTR
jgi:hypothetical protein